MSACRLLLLLTLLCLPMPLPGIAGLTSHQQAESLLAQSRAQTDADQALRLAAQATAADPQCGAAYRWLGLLQERRGMRPEALDAYARAAALEPSATDLREALARIFAQGDFPDSLGRLTPARLPGTWDLSSLLVGEQPAAAAPARWGLAVCLPGNTRSDVARDRRYHGEYRLAAYTLLQPPGEDRYRLVCRTHFQPGREALARDCARLAATLALLGACRLGKAWTAGRTLDLWLAEDGRPGAEGWADNVYLWNVGTPRQPTEWVRQLAHEFGHMGIGRGLRGFGEPEPWANGRAGELLFVRWLLATGAEPALPWLTPALAQWHERQVQVCLAALDAVGGPQHLAGEGQEAVDRAAGFLAMLEACYGTQTLARVLSAGEDPSAGAVVAAAQEVLAARLDAGLDLATGGWLYLPAGSLEVVSGEGSFAPSPQDQKARALRPGAPLSVTAGWYRLQVAVPPLQLRAH